MDRAIIVDNLIKNFEVTEKESGTFGPIKSLLFPKKNTAHSLSGLSFSIQSGELVGILGTTGAGKTTLIKILSGLLFPTSGFVEVLEYDPWERKIEFLKQISLVTGQKNQPWWDFPVIETFNLNQMIYELPSRQYEENLNELTDLLGVGKLLYTPVRKLTFGQIAKMELISGLIHKPKISFLDEPTVGLDTASQQKIRDFIYEYNKKNNSTILLTASKIDDLVNLVRRVIVIDTGQIIFDGLIDDLVGKYAKEKIIRATLTNDQNIKDLEKIGTVKKLSFPEVVITTPRSASAIAASELLQNFPVDNLKIEELPTLEVVKNIKWPKNI